MTDILGQIMVSIIIIGAIGYALIMVYRFLKKEGIIGSKNMAIINFGGEEDTQQPTWEEEKYYALNRGKLSLPDLDRKYEQGWGLIQAVNMNNKLYYYFMKVR